MFAIVYVSVEAIRFTDMDLLNLLAGSRDKNLVSEITGLLLYKDGNFMQLLEGPEPAVRATMEKIKVDPRHRAIQVLMEEEIPTREFSHWSMGFKKLNAATATEIAGYSDFLNDPLISEKFLLHPSQAFRFLLIFKKSVL
jgi:hypothetical protein